jgi:hypothetical protein
MKEPIPEEIALEICEKVQEKNKNKKISIGRMQCWGCIKFSKKKNDIHHRCLFNSEHNDNR